MDYVRITSTEAAKLFNVYPRKGTIAVGSDADVIVLDPDRRAHARRRRRTIRRMDTNVYEGKRHERGKVVTTISRGRLVWHEGKLTAEVTRGSGRYVPLAPFGSAYGGSALTMSEAKVKAGAGAGAGAKTAIERLLDDQQRDVEGSDGGSWEKLHSEL